MRINYLGYGLLLFLFLLNFSCKKSKSKKSIPSISKDIKQRDTVNLTYSDGVVIHAPHSIKRNEYFSGVFKYDTTIDTIKEPNLIDRLIILYISKDHSKSDDYKNYKIISYLDTTRTGKFNFKLKLDTIGNINLIFTIEDLMVLKHSEKLVREITLEKRMSYPIFISE